MYRPRPFGGLASIAASFAIVAALSGSEPKSDRDADANDLVRRLADDDWNVRTKAEADLRSLGVDAFPQLFEGTFSDDAEVARRARRALVRLESDAFEPLHAIAEADDASRAARARLLLAGLTDRLVERKIAELIERIETAEEEGRVTESERGLWIGRLTRANSNLYVETTVDRSGKIVESSLELQLAGREAVPIEWLTDGVTGDPPDVRAFRAGESLPAKKYEPLWAAFREIVGPELVVRDLFAEMLSSEPALMEAAADALSSRGRTDGEAVRTRQILGGLYDLRDQAFIASFNERKQGQRPQAGKPYPDVFDDATLARLATFLFVRSEFERLPGAPLTAGVSRAFSEGIAGYLPSKQPVFEMVKSPSDDRARALRTLLETALLTSETGADLQASLTTAMSYRLQDVCRALAARILDEVPEAYASGQKDRAVHLAAHALLSFGKGSDDLKLAATVLENAGQIRGGYRKEENRPYMEVREMGLMAVLRLLGKKPAEVGGADRVTAYCPIRRFTKFDAIRDSERWPEINKQVEAWIEAAVDEGGSE